MARRDVEDLLKDYNSRVEDRRMIEELRQQAAHPEDSHQSLRNVFVNFENQGWRNISHHRLEFAVDPMHTVLPLNANISPSKILTISLININLLTGNSHASLANTFWQFVSPETIQYICEHTIEPLVLFIMKTLGLAKQHSRSSHRSIGTKLR